MTFLQSILDRLEEAGSHEFLVELGQGTERPFTGRELRDGIAGVRAFARGAGLKKGDRCALLADNSGAWAMADLGLMAEGVLVVPLYGRAKASEIGSILADSEPRLVLCGTEDQREVLEGGPAAGVPTALLGDALEAEPVADGHAAVSPDDPVAIVYTSGTSGEPKGVVLTAGNLDHMLGCTSDRVGVLMRGEERPDRVFHYLPFCFAGAWILLLLSLTRGSRLYLNTDLQRIVEDLAIARPDYFQNVPILLERMRSGVEQALERKGGMVARTFRGAKRAALARARGEKPGRLDGAFLTIGRHVVFPSIKKRIGAGLKALICGSASLREETQLFFEMIGVPILQVYGLTETTAICTMDMPGEVEAGKVGRAIEGVEMRLGENDEIQVRGPNVFSGYWNRPDATAESFVDGWFRTGDQGEVDETGNWTIRGRIKNLIVPESGHNIAPEPLEETLNAMIPSAAQVVLLGNERPHLIVVITGDVSPEEVETALERFNEHQPHYRRIRGSLLRKDPFSVESGLITANGKVRRATLEKHLAREIDDLYAREGARRPETAGRPS